MKKKKLKWYTKHRNRPKKYVAKVWDFVDYCFLLSLIYHKDVKYVHDCLYGVKKV